MARGSSADFAKNEAQAASDRFLLAAGFFRARVTLYYATFDESQFFDRHQRCRL